MKAMTLPWRGTASGPGCCTPTPAPALTQRATPMNCCVKRSRKKLKELRRQRHRLAEHGDVRFDVARTPEEIAAAIEVFLASKPAAGRPASHRHDPA